MRHCPVGAEWVCPQLGNSSKCGGPINDSTVTLSCPPGTVEQVYTHKPTTALSLRALQRAVTQDLWNPPGRITVSPHCRSLRNLAHRKLKTVCPRGFMEERITIFWLWGWWLGLSHFYFDPLKKHGKPSGNKSHTEPSPLARGSATLPRQRHLRSSKQVPPPEDQLEEQVHK